MDVGELINLFKRNGIHDSAFVYGVSYGTYWAERYMQLFPRQAKGVILDSVVAQTGSDIHPRTSFARLTEGFDFVGR